METELVIFERIGAVGLLRINREKKLNALNRSIFDALMAYLDEAARDESLQVLILTGSGRAFCAGADIKEYWQQGSAAFSEFQRRGRTLNDAIEHHPKPVIAAINGFALGGGFELALCCDLLVANEQALFGLPEPTLGLVPGGGGTQRLPRLIGRHRAKELLLTGRRLSAREALEWGIVSAVVPVGEEIAEAQRLAASITALAPLAVRSAKRLVNEGLDAPLPTALSYEQQTLVSLYGTRDGQEGIAAFMEKRAPRFSGE